MSDYLLSYEKDYSEEDFYAAVQTLKQLKALPEDSFVNDVAFFNLDAISAKTQVSELFRTSDEYVQFIASLNNALLSGVKTEESEADPSSLMLTFAQICLYKVLPCHEINCPDRPREVVTHNQYKDHEYQCPFYHHDKDRRRLVISKSSNGDFLYKANYFEEGKGHTEREKYSQNYFESMFHPLYYKMFRCKRTHCRSHRSCPFYHYEEEKKVWDRTFNTFVQKDRVTYVKDKQKYYQSISPLEIRKESFSQNQSPYKSTGLSRSKNSQIGSYLKSPKTAGAQISSSIQKNEICSAKIKKSNKIIRVETTAKSQVFDADLNSATDLKRISFDNYHGTKQSIKNRVC